MKICDSVSTGVTVIALVAALRIIYATSALFLIMFMLHCMFGIVR